MSKNEFRKRKEDKEDKRPSVFERLGVRKDAASLGGYQSTSSSTRWPDSRHQLEKHRSPSFSPAPTRLKESSRSSESGSYHPVQKKIKDKHKAAAQLHVSKKDKKKHGVQASKKKVVKAKAGKKKVRESSPTSSSDGSISTSSVTSSPTSSSSSDSSVPSIKLKSEKLRKKKIKKPPSPIVSSTSESGEAPDPPQYKSHKSDLREKLNARSPHVHITPGNTGKKIKHYEEQHQQSMDVGYSKKQKRERPPSQEEPYPYEDIKRRRMLSPPQVERYRSPDEHSHRRAPPSMQNEYQIKERGNPNLYHQKDPRSGHSPLRRPPSQLDGRRPDFREKERRPYPTQIQHPQAEYDRRREPGQAPVDYMRDNRPRQAPSRQQQQQQPPPGLMDSKIDRIDRDYHQLGHQHQLQQQRRGPGQPSSHPRSYQQDAPRNYGGRGGPPLPHAPQSHHQQQQYDKGGGYRPPPLLDVKRLPLIPKSKAALAERYEYEQTKGKSGYVDKWVNETVRTTTTQDRRPMYPPRPNPNNPNYLTKTSPKNRSVSPSVAIPPPPTSIPYRSDDKKKESQTSQAIKPIPADDLSDFSDDADDLLKVIDSPEGSVITSEPPQSQSIPSPMKDAAPAASPDKPASLQQRTTSVDTVPSISNQSQGHSKAATTTMKSLASQSQTDDDIFERMDFEEISDEELGEVETNKVHIVDALGVDWASLVCQEKKNDPPAEGVLRPPNSVRNRWKAINILSSVGISKALAGESLYNHIRVEKEKEDQENGGKDEPAAVARQEDFGILERIGLGPNSRALCSRRDMAVRRHFLGLPPKSLLSIDVFRSSTTCPTPPTTTTTITESGSLGELYKMSQTLLKSENRTTPIASS